MEKKTPSPLWNPRASESGTKIPLSSLEQKWEKEKWEEKKRDESRKCEEEKLKQAALDKLAAKGQSKKHCPFQGCGWPATKGDYCDRHSPKEVRDRLNAEHERLVAAGEAKAKRRLANQAKPMTEEKEKAKGNKMGFFRKLLMMPTYRRVKARLANDQHLKIRCAKCGTEFVLGVDSKLWTHEESEARNRQVFDVSIVSVPAGVSEQSYRTPDLVVCKELNSEERQKTIRDLEIIYQDLCSGVGRGWYCSKNKGDCHCFVNAYPLPH
jgi:hypothetical protein